MIRKNAISLISTAVMALAILSALVIPAMSVTDNGSLSAENHANAIYADDIPTFTPTPGAGTDSNPSGGGNGGG